jgi:hypothetical protein
MNTTVKINSVKEKNFMEKISKETASVSTEVCVITQRNTRLPFLRKKMSSPLGTTTASCASRHPALSGPSALFQYAGGKGARNRQLQTFFLGSQVRTSGSHPNANGSHFVGPQR